MKTRIITGIICIFLLLSFSVVAYADVIPDEEIAKEHGYVIMSTEAGPFYWDPETYVVPNEMIILLNKKLDLEQYKGEGKKDFYGIDIIEIDALFDEATIDKVVEQIGPIYSYHIYTADFYTREEANQIFEVLAANEPDFIEGTISGYSPNWIDEPQEPKYEGDINGNKKIDMTDYILLKRAYFGTYTLDESQQTKGDINENGKIDMTDYILLKRMYFGTWKTTWEPEINQSTQDEVLPD